MIEVFKNQQFESTFRKKGYLLIDYLDDKEIEILFRQLQELNPSDFFQGRQKTKIGEQTIHITFFDSNHEYREKVHSIAQNIMQPFVSKYLNDYSCAQSNVFLKQATSGYIHPHQNLTIVDEEEFTSVSLWMPLQDTSIENGTICLIPGSQNHFEKYRNTHVYWPYIHFFREELGLNYFETINVKKGSVLVIDDRIVHYTPTNQTSHPRWVLHSLWKPKTAPCIFCDPKDNWVEIFRVHEEFWQFYEPNDSFDSHDSPLKIPYQQKHYSENELIQLLESLKTELITPKT